MLGTAYYHPVLPLIPPADREEQLARWLGLGRHLFCARSVSAASGRPSSDSAIDLIPTVARQGYEWVIVDSEHVRPVTPMSWEELRYRPHRARVDGSELIVVVRDRDLSNAQESGMEVGLVHRGGSRTHPALRLPAVGHDRDRRRQRRLVSQHHRGLELLDQLLQGSRRPRARRPSRAASAPPSSTTTSTATAPTAGSPSSRARGTRASTTARGSSSGPARPRSATPWPGSGKSATPCRPPAQRSGTTKGAPGLLEQARWRVLRAETSCNFYWGEAGCSAATTTSTKPVLGSTRRCTRPEPSHKRRRRCWDALTKPSPVERLTLHGRLPEALAPLAPIAYNYRWCWYPDGKDVFRSIDEARWELCGENPVRLSKRFRASSLRGRPVITICLRGSRRLRTRSHST